MERQRSGVPVNVIIQFKNKIMKLGKLLVGIFCLAFLGACGDDDKKDDSGLNLSDVVGRNWYYNAWVGDKYGMKQEDMLEVIRFEQGGALKKIDFGGRQEYIIGKWESEADILRLKYNSGNEILWNVMKSNKNELEVKNVMGERTYTSDDAYLSNLTADAFWVNDYDNGANRCKTYIGANVEGHSNLRNVELITGNGEYSKLKSSGYHWEIDKKNIKDTDFDEQEREVRFYLRVGEKTEFKLKDTLYNSNLPECTAKELALSAESFYGDIKVSWIPYDRGEVYYKIEIFPKSMDYKDVFFVSKIQSINSSSSPYVFTINSNSVGEVNRLNELKKGENYTVRLTAILFEPNVNDWYNDKYSYANIQAVSYFTKTMVWE